MTIYDCIAVFKQKVSWGSIYPCISCEGYYFRSSVIKANMDKMKQKQIFEDAVDIINIYNKPNFYVKNNFWICKYCNQSIIQGSLPKRTVVNALKVYECNLPRLSEVENVFLGSKNQLHQDDKTSSLMNAWY